MLCSSHCKTQTDLDLSLDQTEEEEVPRGYSQFLTFFCPFFEPDFYGFIFLLGFLCLMWSLSMLASATGASYFPAAGVLTP